MGYKNYLQSLRFFILFSFLVFIFAAIFGYFLIQNSPQTGEMVLEEIRETYKPVIDMRPLGQLLFVIFNNGLTLVLVILLGIAFGIFPLLVLLLNGTILGILAFSSKGMFSWSVFFIGILPHGIIEIPVLILACAVGLKIGKTAFQKVFKKQSGVRAEISCASEFFIKTLLPLLVLAAAIEIFVTSWLLGM